jgi:predicted acetyltransferase
LNPKLTTALAAVPEPPNHELRYADVAVRFARVLPGDPVHGFVPAWHFRIYRLDDGADAGHVNLRIGATDHVRLYAGHLGYQVAETFRGHRFALKSCRALRPIVRSVYPEVIITADPDNHASLRTIELLGAAFLNEVSVPPSDPNFARGSRAKRRFLWLP